MKKFTKIAVGVLAAALAFATGSMFIGCNGGTEYSFEAEKAVLSDPDGAQNQLVVQSGVEWKGFDENGDIIQPEDDEEVEETGYVGYFGAAGGQTVTWTITSDKACTATLTLRAASCATDMSNMDFTTWSGYLTMGETNVSDAATLTVNGEAVELTGTLPGIEGQFQAMQMMDIFGIGMRNFATVSVQIQLKAGENTVVITSVGGVSLNIDKITIKASANLTYTETDNSTRTPPAMG